MVMSFTFVDYPTEVIYIYLPETYDAEVISCIGSILSVFRRKPALLHMQKQRRRSAAQ